MEYTNIQCNPPTTLEVSNKQKSFRALSGAFTLIIERCTKIHKRQFFSANVISKINLSYTLHLLRFYISANSIFCNISEWYIGLYNLIIIKHVNCGVTSSI